MGLHTHRNQEGGLTANESLRLLVSRPAAAGKIQNLRLGRSSGPSQLKVSPSLPGDERYCQELSSVNVLTCNASLCRKNEKLDLNNLRKIQVVESILLTLEVATVSLFN